MTNHSLWITLKLTPLLLFFKTSFGQTLTVSLTQDIPVDENNVEIEDFSLIGYDASTTYKVSLSVSTTLAGVKFSITSTAGLTRDTGYTSWTNITSVNFICIPSNIQNGLNSIKFNTTTDVALVLNHSMNLIEKLLLK